MAVSTLHTLYALNADPNSGEDYLISQLVDWALDTNLSEELAAADGCVDPKYVAVMSQEPRLRVSTTALATVLGKVGISGLLIEASGSSGLNAVEAWLQKMLSGGTRTPPTTAEHTKLSIGNGLIIPRTINAPLNAFATYDLEISAISSDGSTSPLTITGSQQLTGSPDVTEAFVCGPVKINGSAITGIEDITVDFGIEEIVRQGDGEAYPTFVGIMNRNPSIRVRSSNVGILSTLTAAGAEQGASDSVVYLRKVDEGGTRVADATSEHISFTIDDGRISCQTVGGSQGEPLMAEVIITPTYDGTNAIMVVSAATAIA